MVNGFDVYKIYLAVKLHFTTDSYDYHKYEGKVNCKLETFTKNNARYFFHKLGTKYSKDDILDFFVANFLFYFPPVSIYQFFIQCINRNSILFVY